MKQYTGRVIRMDTDTPLQIGQVLSNGGIVLKYKWRQGGQGEAEGIHGVVLCLLPENKYDPFVVWRFYKVRYGGVADEIAKVLKDDILCSNGDYVQSIETGIRMFNNRKL